MHCLCVERRNKGIGHKKEKRRKRNKPDLNISIFMDINNFFST
jgi:hypothetical protein